MVILNQVKETLNKEFKFMSYLRRTKKKVKMMKRAI